MTAQKIGTSVPRKTGAAGKGRPKGVPNKVTGELKTMILDALSAAGGTAYLTRCAKDPKLAGPFLALVGKVLPMTIAGTGKDGAIVIQASGLDERL